MLNKKNFLSLQDRIRGSLVGGGIGDALVYPVEFISSLEGIKSKYGPEGITRLDTVQRWFGDSSQVGKAVVSDDTQMTLFTAVGLLKSYSLGEELISGVIRAYVEWYYTQTGNGVGKKHEFALTDIKDLNVSRAPGNTCLTALANIDRGIEVRNDSKGCGGVMRIAPFER